MIVQYFSSNLATGIIKPINANSSSKIQLIIHDQIFFSIMLPASITANVR